MVVINLLGLLLIALIIWWFWIYKPREVTLVEDGVESESEGVVTILVENGIYAPSRIRLPAGQPGLLRFIRKDPSACAERVVFADFEISEELPVNTPKDIVLPPMDAGEYVFTCQMQMYRGELIVSANAKP